MNWGWIAMTAVVAALIVSYGVLTGNHRETASSNESVQQLGYYMKDAVITETTPDGNPRVKLAAHSIEQNSKDNSVALFDVRVDYLSIPDKHWVLNADRGTVPANSRTITFIGDVKLQQLEANPGAIIRTASMSVDLDTNIAHSNDPVAIELGGHSVLAHGLTANLKAERVRLESQVHGRFQRQ